MILSVTKKLNELKEKTPNDYQDIVHYLEHAFKQLDVMIEEHNRMNYALISLGGHKINGEHENIFKETVVQVKEHLLLTLERTIEDILHRGDKHWVKNFADGVD